MILFDWKQHELESLEERFPKEGLYGLDWLERELDKLADGVWRPPTERPSLPAGSRPRLFVSHRRHDEECARRVAWRADQAGFDVWLDVLDPQLAGASTPLAIATIIEMALLNSTHVGVVMTPNTNGSQWVPYEYGRVKDGVTLTDQALCCRSPPVPVGNLPEYMLLGGIVDDEAGLSTWLGAEFSRWVHHHGPCGGQPTGHWNDPVPQRLWTACQAADDARAGA